jgi:pyruvate dehydrogenase E1 component alpha subunit
VSVAFFGDGATEEGHFHESMNLAGVYRLPVIFVCENNFYASHMGLLERRVADNIVKSAEAHGIAGASVDGNDAAAMFVAASSAVRRARAGEGPTLIEARTYRWRGHVGASWDMDVGVQRKDELREWLPKDPVARAAAWLQAAGVTAAALDVVRTEAVAEVAAAVEFARASPYPPPSDLTTHVYTTAAAR